MPAGIPQRHSNHKRLQPLQIASRRLQNRAQVARQHPLHCPTASHLTPEVISEQLRANSQSELADHRSHGKQEACRSEDTVQSTLREAPKDLCVDRPSIGCKKRAVQADTSLSFAESFQSRSPNNGKRMTLGKLQKQRNEQIIKECVKRDLCASKPPSAAARITIKRDFDSVTFNASHSQEGELSAMNVDQTSNRYLEFGNTAKTTNKPKGRNMWWSFLRLSRFAPTVKVHPSISTGH